MEYDMDRMLEKIFPKEVSSIDGAILVSALLKTASFVADLHNIENDRTKFEKSFTKNRYDIHCPSSGFSCGFTIDDDGRITRLSLFEDQQELLKIIALFERLTDLALWCRQSIIPMELSNLPQLQTLTLRTFSDLFDINFLVQMDLSKLKKLSICGFRSESTQTLMQLIAWMTKQLPILEELEFDFSERNVTDSFLNALSTVEDICFKGSLKYLKLPYCNIDQNIFETLWNKIVPKLTELFSLDLEMNDIESIQPTVERIISDNITVTPNQLQELNLHHNPIMKNLKEDPNEKVAMLSFLESYNSIYSIWSCESACGKYVDIDYWYDSDIEYALRINHAGRSIVECSNRKEDHHSSLPLSLWPIVLERAYKKSGHIYPRGSTIRRTNDATGLHYLVRQCIALRVQSSNDTTEIGVGGEEEEEDNSGNKNENESDNDIEEGDDNSSVLTVPSLKRGERKRKRILLDSTWVANVSL
ncbi:hypothetical protein FRACYDRAFT_235160 [Fragilariopsis cylindrus CCMP1102]|uniref:RNI-like protein n=1 Tax=Fragilariopsis cylindrus CCMP1102 TaxID=635003 RepID=A0A1E7FTV6_9STRA|nr:hypothetical protein FRACYDRAFT_235160 [Fragilariopsis cylindrus CCMP1102]|eukprot:OEU21535.1 hypothetical protein FRACYDRAFT_235160 [Fragilariopsis cylindrus CCMP1102]